jgi:hypothetical protein
LIICDEDNAVADEASSRRERLTIKAFDPVTGGEIEVYISYERLMAIGKRSKGQVMEVAEVVPQALQYPAAVFDGLTTDTDEDQRGVGWRCYCVRPDRSYAPDGTKSGPRRGQVYLVFVNEDRVAYNWRWEAADRDNPELPQDYLKRFKRRLQ